jgi:hypothetical protein
MRFSRPFDIAELLDLVRRSLDSPSAEGDEP